MNKPIINPDTLSEEQREAIMIMYDRFATHSSRKDSDCNKCLQRIVCDNILVKIFGFEFFANTKGE